MTIDEGLAAYLRTQYDALVAAGALLCAEPADAEPVVQLVLARLAARPRFLRPGFLRPATTDADQLDTDQLDAAVRRRLAAACIAHDKRRGRVERGGSGDVRVMAVVTDRGPVSSGPSELVRQALAQLPPRRRVALVMRHLDETRYEPRDPAGRDARVADQLGWPVSTLTREAQAGLTRLEDVLAVDPVGAATGRGTSRTEALLTRALEEVSPPRYAADPVASITRRARSLRRRRAVVTASAAAVVGLVGAQVLTGGSDAVVTPVSRAAAATPPSPPQLLARVASAYPSGVAVGDGYLWTVELHPTGRRGGTTVERRSLASGRVERSYRVPGEDFGIGYGLGRVWTWGADAVRPLASDVSTLDPVTSAVRTVAVGRGQIDGVAFAAGRAWFSQPHHNRVVALTRALHARAASYPANDAGDIAAFGPDSVIVLTAAGVLIELPLNVVINHTDPSLTYLSADSSYGVWIGHGGELTYSPAIDKPLTVSLRLPLTVAHVAGSPKTGVYVATSSQSPLHYDPYLAYYSAAALREKRPRPTATLGGAVQVESMTADGRGGLVFVTTDGVIARWNPVRPQFSTGAAALAGSLR